MTNSLSSPWNAVADWRRDCVALTLEGLALRLTVARSRAFGTGNDRTGSVSSTSSSSAYLGHTNQQTIHIEFPTALVACDASQQVRTVGNTPVDVETSCALWSSEHAADTDPLFLQKFDENHFAKSFAGRGPIQQLRESDVGTRNMFFPKIGSTEAASNAMTPARDGNGAVGTASAFNPGKNSTL